MEDEDSPTVGQSGVLFNILKSHISGEDVGYIREADKYIDSSLFALKGEEPALKEWLEEDEDLKRVLKSNMSAIYGVFLDDRERGRSLEYTLRRVRILLFRLSCSVAWRAVMRDRDLVENYKIPGLDEPTQIGENDGI